MATQPYIPGDRFHDVVPDRPGLLTAKDVAAALAISVKTVYALTARGELPYVKIGGAVRYRPTAIRKWLEKREYLPRELM